MAPEVKAKPVRWIVTGLAMIVLGLIAVGAAYLAIDSSRTVSEQSVKLLALETAANQAKLLRSSEVRAEQARCRQTKAATKQTRTVVEDLRSTYLELAANTLNPTSAEILRKRAKHLPMFPPSKCDPGPKPKKAVHP